MSNCSQIPRAREVLKSGWYYALPFVALFVALFWWNWSAQLAALFGCAVTTGFGVVENLGHAPPLAQQKHRVGPVLYTELELAEKSKISVDVGVFFGLTPETADVAVKLNFGVPLYAVRNRSE